MRLAILGSASNNISTENKNLCKKVGKYIAQNKIIFDTEYKTVIDKLCE